MSTFSLLFYWLKVVWKSRRRNWNSCLCLQSCLSLWQSCIGMLPWTQGFASFLTFKLAHCPTPAAQTATSWLSHLMTELFNGLCTSITLRNAIMPCFPNVTTHKKNSKKKSYAQRATQHSAGTALARHRTQHLKPLAFATPCTHIDCENTGILSLTLPYFQTCTSSHACHTNCHLLTEPPHDGAIQWWVTMSYLLITLPLDWASQCLLPFDYSTTWLSYSSVSYRLISLPLDWATSWLLYHLTELSNCF